MASAFLRIAAPLPKGGSLGNAQTAGPVWFLISDDGFDRSATRNSAQAAGMFSHRRVSAEPLAL
jgi:hypothetical protein